MHSSATSRNAASAANLHIIGHNADLERDNLLAALDARFVPPGLSGAPGEPAGCAADRAQSLFRRPAHHPTPTA